MPRLLNVIQSPIGLDSENGKASHAPWRIPSVSPTPKGEGAGEAFFIWANGMSNSKSAIKIPDQSYLKECLIYDKETGSVTWKIRPLHHFKNAHGMNTFNSQHAGRIAGGMLNDRYLAVHLSGKYYLLHRVIWKLVTGNDPVDKIDHKDRAKLNNKWANLREATQQQNVCNRGLSSINKTGFKGVSWDKSRGKFFACIQENGKTVALGRFDNLHEAAQAYRNASLKIHGEFANI